MTRLCDSCMHTDYCMSRATAGAVIVGCARFEKQKPITRGNNIRKMNDKQLAAFLNQVETDGRCGIIRGSNGWLEWLEQEVE